MSEDHRAFYERAYAERDYSPPERAEDHAFYPALRQFVAQYQLSQSRCLEVGTGRGAFQWMSAAYVGVDIAWSAGAYVRRPFTVASADRLPFRDNVFDAIWTITVLEHVIHPEQALEEMWRVLRPGGYLFLAPAWQCRPWAAQGYPVRPYADLDWHGKLIKASIPLRNSVMYRSFKVFPRRLLHLVRHCLQGGTLRFRYRTLAPNFDTYWMSDSDAINSMDPFDAYLWFESRGAVCLNYPTLTEAFLIRTGPLIMCKPPVTSELEAR